MMARAKAEPVRHKVEPNKGGWYDVTSGRSGEVHKVTPVDGINAKCTCKAGEFGRVCSHVRAVRDFAAEHARRATPDPAAEAFRRAEADAKACNCGAIAADRAHSVDPRCPALDVR
jgi:hypothetical protein